MLARLRTAWRDWRERRRQYAIDRAMYKMGGGGKRGPGPEDGGPHAVGAHRDSPFDAGGDGGD
jgi:hypothetical protein